MDQSRSGRALARLGVVGAAGLVAALVMACADPSTAPFPIPASLYVAESANGAPLPVRFPDDGVTRYYLDYLSVSFERDGTALRVQTMRVVNGTTGAAQIYTNQGRFRVRVRGDTVTLVPNCPPNALALCIGPEVLLRSGADLTMNLGLPTPTTVRLVRH